MKKRGLTLQIWQQFSGYFHLKNNNKLKGFSSIKKIKLNQAENRPYTQNHPFCGNSARLPPRNRSGDNEI